MRSEPFEHDHLSELDQPVPDSLVGALAGYIRFGATLEGVVGFDGIAEDAWQDFAAGITAYTHELGRFMTHGERVDLFVRASQQAYDERQKHKLPETDDRLVVPAQFLNPRIVSDEGWMYIGHFYQHPVWAPRPSLN